MRLGDTGPRVRELNERLAALAVSPSSEHDDVFESETLAYVQAFQRSRGLPLTGIVDATTWERLAEARWLLGQRLLYHTRPNLRGDDVAELQVRLAQLGFNPGRIDGIFGSLTAAALSEFQRNCALEASGTMNKETLQAIQRVRATNGTRSLVTDARDLAGFDPVTGGSVLLCGDGLLVRGLTRYFENSSLVHTLTDTTQEVAAHAANTHDVALVLSFQTLEHVEGIHLHYWASYRSHSHRGELLASSLASYLARLPDVPRVEVTGMALPILRETKMTTIHIEHGNISEQVLHQAITAFEGIVEQVIHRSE
ncbi:MAG: peptidoglycan-binding protein [Acidimicrobiales bacterium]